MNTVDELVYYCNEVDPVGAIMLTGQWGSGKTYLIEHELAEKLKDTHIIIRISLFGVDSIDSFNHAVRKQWISKCNSILSKLQDKKKLIDTGKSLFSEVIPFVPALKKIKGSALNTILSIDPLDYITVKKEVTTVNGKKDVVLVFDDLERSKLDTITLLGCINEYCENQGFHTVIVVNEGKIPDKDKKENSSLSYNEIKEKIVERTIYLKPDFDGIIDSIIENKSWQSTKYKEFLKDNKALIKSLFKLSQSDGNGNEDRSSDDTVDYVPQNIRILKCALQDFYRIYEKLSAERVPDLDKYLYSFLAYSMVSKSGIKLSNDEDQMFTDNETSDIYPLYENSKMFDSAKNWVNKGEWNQNAFSRELKLAVEMSKPLSQKDILRLTRFELVEDETIKTAFKDLLNDAYLGKLSLDEYVVFIENCHFIRTYKIDVNTSIDWKKITAGINTCINEYLYKKEPDQTHKFISDEDLNYLNDDELNAYKLIRSFRENGIAIFAENRKQYLDLMKSDSQSAFVLCRNKQMNVFDAEMAKATLDAFDTAPQYDKARFGSQFYNLWKYIDQEDYIKADETIKGLTELKNLLVEKKSSYLNSDRKVAAMHTDKFIEKVSQLISKLRDAEKRVNTTDSNESSLNMEE
ncbi:P-loop NTPase fold protein [Lactimicrobium massiliense]|uniref:P-loop NTPase fold protein n=1 Tax=Lactimicrobium massiliense TaxID=2161814 RepID=UPI000D54CDB1|nr:P-loop NTPase fold protein [Lactimicrobium massiliense]